MHLTKLGLPDLPWRVTVSSVVTQVGQRNWLSRQPHLGLTTGDPVEPQSSYRVQFIAVTLEV
jgi:hypothetical protein